MAHTIVTWLVSNDVPLFTFGQRHASQLRDATGATVRIAGNEAEFVAALPDADIVLTWRFRQEWFAHAPRLRWIATPAAGRDDLRHLTLPVGVRVTHGTFHGEFMAETVVGMMLAEVRGIADALRLPGPWPRREIAARMKTLRGSHVVILGYGHIGKWIAGLLQPFGVRITGIRRHAAPDALPVTELDSVLPTTDHLVLVLPAEEDSRNLMDARRLALLPPHAILYSVGRGHCVDEAALAAALGRGRLRAAYLDVFQKEPLPATSPLRGTPGFVLLPHASAAADQYLDRFVAEVIVQYGDATGRGEPGGR
jgi:phosphoglycerate dehydrogenase-like enzyme